MLPRPIPYAVALVSGLVALHGGALAQFADNTADIPQGGTFNGSHTENVDFGDVDLDGDWDAAFADGGDCCNDQNRLWVNQGGTQGGTLGVFVDRTTQQFPSFQDQSRDIEFVDIDGDGDIDIYTSNTSAITNQSNRWWVNQGNAQAGSLGTYLDDTAARWVGLGQPGSSIAPSQVIGSGGFIDWSCDCDFGDLDNDGDLDLVHSTYGGAFGGQVPTRIFLNDGAGFFSEFNPSGFQLSGSSIQNGDPGLWCDGSQSADTTNSTGVSCDVASSALDIDLGDIDGDFDLDILHGARQEVPRMFANRLDASGLAADAGGSLAFRDVTGAVFPASYSFGNGHYEQELGDLDGDGDLDIYGLNWRVSGFSFTDATYRNTGGGVFDDTTDLAGSGSDDNEGDFLDYDNDGDLDLYVANFSGSDRLYRNDNNGGPAFGFTEVTGSELPALSFTGLDADAADVDGDGDYDVFVANDNDARNVYLENLSGTPDTTPPHLPNLEQAPDRDTGPSPTVVRVHVYDNAPYYVTQYNETDLVFTVDAGPPTVSPMTSSGGQVFRAEIPGELDGAIDYWVESTDEHGNVGTSAVRSYVASAPCGAVNYCTAKINSQGCTPAIGSTGTPGLSGPDDFFVTASDVVNNQFGFLLWSRTQNALPFYGGTLCIAVPITRTPVQSSGGNPPPLDCSGSFSFHLSQAYMASEGVGAGDTLYLQYWYRDPGVAELVGLTDGLSVTLCE